MDEGLGYDTNQQPLEFIYINESYHPLYVSLIRECQEKEKHPPFREMKNIFMLAALIGCIQDKYEPLEGNTQNIFARTVFKDDDMSLLRALALIKTGKPEVLRNEKKIQNIAQGYANGGISVIKEQIEDRPGKRIDNLVDLLLSWEPYNDLISLI